MEGSTRPQNLTEEGLNLNICQTEELPGSPLSSKTHGLIGETAAESTHMTEPQHEQDRMCAERHPEDQEGEKEDTQSGKSSGAESEDVSHGEGGR